MDKLIIVGVAHVAEQLVVISKMAIVKFAVCYFIRTRTAQRSLMHVSLKLAGRRLIINGLQLLSFFHW